MLSCWNKFFLRKMSSSFSLWVSQCELLIKVFSCMTFKRIIFHIFAPSTRNSKKILIIFYSKYFLVGRTSSPPFLTFMNFFFFFFFFFSAAFNCPFSNYMKKSLGTYFEQSPACRKNGNTALSTVRWYPKISSFSEKEKIVRGSAPHFSKKKSVLDFLCSQ